MNFLTDKLNSAGVIGLSSALELQAAGYSVTIIARDLPAPFETIDPRSQINFTSPWGGAHNRWVVPTVSGEHAREHRWALATFARMQQLASSSSSSSSSSASAADTATTTTAAAHGITFLKGIEYLESPPPEYATLTESRAVNELGMVGFRLLTDPKDLPADGRVKWGCEYDTWCVNPMLYCSFLLTQFMARGGKVHGGRTLRNPAEVFYLTTDSDLNVPRVDAVVNASGNGFGGGDGDVFVTRGQTCLVREPCAATVTRQNADGSWTFSVPRGFGGGTVIGGTKEPDNWDPRPDPEVRERLLRSFEATYPKMLEDAGVERLTPLRDIVGRRPTRRGGPRLEAENANVNGGNSGLVVHAYGLGGRGYELSWGVAQGVVEEVRRNLKGPASKL